MQVIENAPYSRKNANLCRVCFHYKYCVGICNGIFPASVYASCVCSLVTLSLCRCVSSFSSEKEPQHKVN
nr:MAG TPA: hypothetical protein [Caudoviricetes sp.]